MLDGNPDLLGPVARSGPARFEQMLVTALHVAGNREPDTVAQTLISVSIGIKHQVASRDMYRIRMASAAALLTR